MADSPVFQSATPATLPSGTVVSTEEVSTLNGGAVTAQHVQRFLVAFRTSDGVAVDLPGDAANGLDVDVTRVQGTVAVSGPATDTQLRATPLPVSGSVTISDGSGPVTVDGTVSVGNLPATQAISAAALPLPAGASTSAKQDTAQTRLDLLATEATLDARTGILTETAPASDTASSGLNGRLQRVAQRLSSLIALVPASLGQKTKANSFAVTLASDQDALPITDNAGSLTVDGTVAATQSGTWTVQPGNTANTTAWKVDGSAVTQPVSGTVSVNALPAGTNNIGDVDVVTMPTVTTKQAGTTGAQTSVASTTTPDTTLIAANANRFGLTIFNDSTAVLFVLYGAGTESSTVYSVQIAAGGYLEVPDAFVTMRMSGHWASANGNARITTAT